MTQQSQMRIADFDSIQQGESASIEFEVTEQQVEQFASLSGDDNALHMDAEYAQQRGFQGRVAHGMLAMSVISNLIGTKLPGHGSLWVSQQCQYTEPVMLGDTLVGTVRVEQISRATEAVILSTEVVTKGDQRVVLRGKAGVRIPRMNIEASTQQ